jgi:hypothetical protein
MLLWLALVLNLFWSQNLSRLLSLVVVLPARMTQFAARHRILPRSDMLLPLELVRVCCGRRRRWLGL